MDEGEDDQSKPSYQEGLELLKAFLRITDPQRRAEIVAIVNKAAEESKE